MSSNRGSMYGSAPGRNDSDINRLHAQNANQRQTIMLSQPQSRGNYRGGGGGFAQSQYTAHNQPSFARGGGRPAQAGGGNSSFQGSYGNQRNTSVSSHPPSNPLAFHRQGEPPAFKQNRAECKPEPKTYAGSGIKWTAGGANVKAETDVKLEVPWPPYTASTTASKQQSAYADLYKKSPEEILKIIDIELLGADPLSNKAAVFNHNAQRLEKLSEGRVVLEAKVQPASGPNAATSAFVMLNEHELLRVAGEGVRKSLELAKCAAVDMLLQNCRISAVPSKAPNPVAPQDDDCDMNADNDAENAGRADSSASSAASPGFSGRNRRSNKLTKVAFGDFISDELGPLQESDEQCKNLTSRDRTLLRCLVMSTPKLSSQIDVQQFFNHLVQLNHKNGILIGHSTKQVRGDARNGGGNFHVTQIALNGDVIAVSTKNSNLKNSVREARAMAVTFLENNCTFIDRLEPKPSSLYRLRYEHVRDGTWEQMLTQQEAEFQKDACCFGKSHFGRKMLEKMGWKEGDKLGVSDVSQFNARDVALRSRMPMAATLQRAALGSVEGKMEEQITALLLWYGSEAVRNEWKVLQISGLQSRWRKLIHTQAMSHLLNTESVKAAGDNGEEKTLTVSHKRSIGEILATARLNGTGVAGIYRVVREAQIKKDEEFEW